MCYERDSSPGLLLYLNSKSDYYIVLISKYLADGPLEQGFPNDDRYPPKEREREKNTENRKKNKIV